jgi:hypothetical protein
VSTGRQFIAAAAAGGMPDAVVNRLGPAVCAGCGTLVAEGAAHGGFAVWLSQLARFGLGGAELLAARRVR